MKYLFLFIVLCTSLLGAEQRIVALAPSINEILFALGKGESVVGNTTYATYPEVSKKISKVGGYFSVSLEKIVALRPTLVLLQRNNLALKPKLEKLGIRTELIRISSLDDLKAGIMKIGELTHARQRAAEIIKEINEAVKSTAGILKGKKILIVFGVNFDLKKEVFISGNHLYFADIIRASGNQNAFFEETNRQPVISMEGIIALNPDIVYILAHRVKEKETEELIAPWLKLPVTAARAGTIYVTTQKYAGMPSQRVVLFIRDFKEVLEDAKRKLASLQD